MPIPLQPLPGEQAPPAEVNASAGVDWHTPFTGALDGADASQSALAPRTFDTRPLAPLTAMAAGSHNPDYGALSPLPTGGAYGQFPITPLPVGKTVTPGNIDLNLLDPMSVLAQATGNAIGRNPLIGGIGAAPGAPPQGDTGIDPAAFLAGHGIEPLQNAPSRMADYALAPAQVLLNHLLGTPTPSTTVDAQGFPVYAWQKDPNYRTAVGQMNNGDLYTAAQAVANQYQQGYQNGALSSALYDQFQHDKQKALGLSSGDAGVDYSAKQALAKIVDVSKKYGITPDEAIKQMSELPTIGGAIGFAGMTLPLVSNQKAMGGGPPPDAHLQDDLNTIRGEAFGRGVNGLPLLGDLARFLQGPGPNMDDVWNGLSKDSRAALLNNATQGVGGATMMAFAGLSGPSMGLRFVEPGTGVLAGTMVTMSGPGIAAVLAPRAAAAADLAIKAAVGSYKAGQTVMVNVIRAGIVSALATWTTEAFVPSGNPLGDFAREVDLARPVSSSAVAGAINFMGYFNSPAEMFSPITGAARLGGRLIGSGARGVAGLQDMAIYKLHYGGSVAAEALDNLITPNAPAGLRATAAKSSILNRGLGLVRDGWLNQIDSIQRDPVAAGFPGSVDWTPEQRVAHAQDQLNLVGVGMPATQASIINLFQAARRPLSAFASEAERTAQNVVNGAARLWDDAIARSYEEEQRTSWARKLVNEDGTLRPFGADALKSWVQEAFQRPDIAAWGANMDEAIKYAGTSEDKWLHLANNIENMEFMAKNGGLQAHVAERVAQDAESDAKGLNVARQDHIFEDQRRSIVDNNFTGRATWRNGDSDVPVNVTGHLPPVNGQRFVSIEGSATGIPLRQVQFDATAGFVRRLRYGTKEGQQWNLTHPNAPDSAFVAFIHDLPESGFLMERRILPAGDISPTDGLNSFHSRLNAEGQYTLAYKPKYTGMTPEGMAANGVEEAAGAPTYVSYHTMPDGQVIQSPYLDYVNSSAEQIELGNQNYIASQIDSAMRGFRTWRITEFQRANLFRKLTPFLNVTGPQIDAFHEGLLKISSETKWYDDTIKLNPQSMTINDLAKVKIQELGERIFGKAPLYDRASGLWTPGDKMNWAKIVRDNYTQGLRLNFTAAITSNLKAMLPFGGAVMFIADVVLPEIRFVLSPLFNWQIRTETQVFNATRGALGRDPEAMAVAASGGVSRSYAQAASELGGDPIVDGLASPGGGSRAKPGDLRFTGRAAPGEPRPPDPTPPPFDVPGGGDAPPSSERGSPPGDRGWYREYTPPPGGSGPNESPRMRFTSADTRTLREKLAAMAADPGASAAQRAIDRMDGVPQSNAQTFNGPARPARAAQPEGPPGGLGEGATPAQLDRGAIAMGAPGPAAAQATLGDVTLGPPLDPLHQRLADAQSALDRAEYELNASVKGPYGTGVYYSPGLVEEFQRGGYDKIITQPADMGFEPYKEANAGSSEAWKAYQDASDELLRARAALPEGEHANLRERADVARINLVQSQRVLGYDVQIARMDYTMAVQELQALADGVPRHAPLQDGFIRQYHGSSAAFDRFDPAHYDPGSLAGPGAYTTSDPSDIAVGYAGGPRATGIVYGVDIPKGLKTLDLDAPLPVDVAQAFVNYVRGIEDEAVKAGHLHRDATGKVVFADPANVPDWANEHALGRWIETADKLSSFGGVATGGAEGWFLHHELLMADASAAPRTGALFQRYTRHAYNQLNNFYSDLGYEAITHVGDVNGAHGLKHKVIVVFDPKNATIVEGNGVIGVFREPVYDTMRANLQTQVDAASADIAKAVEKMGNPRLKAAWQEATSKADAAARELAAPTHVINETPALGTGMDSARAHGLDQTIDRRGQLVQALDDVQAGRPTLDPDTGKPLVAISQDHAAAYLQQRILDAGHHVPGTEPPVAITADPVPLGGGAGAPPDAPPFGAPGTPPDAAPPPGTAGFGSPGVGFDTVPGTGAHAVAVGSAWKAGMDRFGKAWAKMWNATDPKEEGAFTLQLRMLQDYLPDILRAAKSPAVDRLMALKVPERDWAKYLLTDRSLWQSWQDTGSHADWTAFMEHAGKYDGTAGAEAAKANDAFYASPEWTAVSAMWRLTAKFSQQEAFGVHFFPAYRSLVGRTINHPVLGSYPAAWSYKVAKEWAYFLYDNHTLRGLNLGMTPAVALNSWWNAQQSTFAMTHNQSLDQWMTKGPWSEAIFLAQMVLPGTPMGIPFSMSRTLRDIVRGDYNPIDWATQSIWGNKSGGGAGAIRDLSLFSNVANEVVNNLSGNDKGAAASQQKLDKIVGSAVGNGVTRAPAINKIMSNYPTGSHYRR